jgi:glutathione S-transferase
MALTFYAMSGSPYAWRVWLALEHKALPYELKMLSYDAGDLSKPQFAVLNPRRKVPVIVDGDLVVYESAAIVEYLEDKAPGEPRLFSADVKRRAVERRMVREVDQYFSAALEYLVSEVLFTPKHRWSKSYITEACDRIKQELGVWAPRFGDGYLAGDLSAVDFSLYPQLALIRRIGERNAGVLPEGLIGAPVAAWMQRMDALPATQKTWPPHWKS